MSTLTQFANIVDGAAAPTVATFESFDPFTGKPWALVPRCGADAVDAAVGAASRAFRSGPWRSMTPSARGRLLMRFADLVAANAERLAAIETRDNGKLITEMTAQLRYVPWRRRRLLPRSACVLTGRVRGSTSQRYCGVRRAAFCCTRPSFRPIKPIGCGCSTGRVRYPFGV